MISMESGMFPPLPSGALRPGHDDGEDVHGRFVGVADPAVVEFDDLFDEGQAVAAIAPLQALIVLAQAAPGPNVLFIALLGWNLGLNAGRGQPLAWAFGALGVAVCMLGVLLPSCILTWAATRWAHRNRERRSVRAFKQGMAPLVIGLLLATAWVLGSAHGEPAQDWPMWLLSAATTLLVWRTRIHLLWLLGAGALLGAFGWV